MSSASPQEESAHLPLESLVGVVVVNYASSALLASNLAGREFAHSRVVVVDNFSSDAERRRLRTMSEEQGWTLVEQPDNRGFGAGVNAGAAASRRLGCTSVLLLNPDLTVTPEVVDALRLEVTLDPLLLVAPRLVDPSGRTVFEGHVLDLVDGRVRSAAKPPASREVRPEAMLWLTAACLAVHLDLWERVSGFDENYFMYWEDVDFNRRCLSAGARVLLRPDLTAVHDQGGTQGSRRGRAKSPLYYRWNIRNRMAFAVRWLDRSQVARWLLLTPQIGYEVWLRGGRRQLWQSPTGAVAALRGAGEGLALGAANLLGQRPR